MTDYAEVVNTIAGRCYGVERPLDEYFTSLLNHSANYLETGIDASVPGVGTFTFNPLKRYCTCLPATDPLTVEAVLGNISGSSIVTNAWNRSGFLVGEMDQGLHTSEPIRFQDRVFGFVKFTEQTKVIAPDVKSNYLRDLGREMAFQLVRDDVDRAAYIKRKIGARFVGTSRALRDLEEHIERAAQLDCPIVIQGKRGADFRTVAWALHYCGPRKNCQFVEVCADDLCSPEDLNLKVEQCCNGTLYISSIERLQPAMQQILTELINDGAIHTFAGNGVGSGLVVDTLETLKTKVNEGSFSRQLFTHLDFVNLSVPTLADRPEDATHLLDYYLSSVSPTTCPHINQDAAMLLYGCHWQNNEDDIKRLAYRLHIDHCGKEITETVLAAALRHENYILDDKRSSMPVTTSRLDNQPSLQSDSVVVESIDDFAHGLLLDSVDSCDGLHPAVQKALVFLKVKYAEAATLQEIAEAACVSSSHLCYLFRTELSTTFKRMRSAIRIARAKQLFKTQPEISITSASYEVGFHDLSHFERTFRKRTGLNPRDYRKQFQQNRKLALLN
jgi:AraC-like DNA-binding protein